MCLQLNICEIKDLAKLIVLHVITLWVFKIWLHSYFSSYRIPSRPVCNIYRIREELLSNSRFIIQLFYKGFFISHRHHASELFVSRNPRFCHKVKRCFPSVHFMLICSAHLAALTAEDLGGRSAIVMRDCEQRLWWSRRLLLTGTSLLCQFRHIASSNEAVRRVSSGVWTFLVIFNQCVLEVVRFLKFRENKSNICNEGNSNPQFRIYHFR